MRFIVMHITNQILRFDIFTVGNVLDIFREHDFYYPDDFWYKRKPILTHLVYVWLLLHV